MKFLIDLKRNMSSEAKKFANWSEMFMRPEVKSSIWSEILSPPPKKIQLQCPPPPIPPTIFQSWLHCALVRLHCPPLTPWGQYRPLWEPLIYNILYFSFCSSLNAKSMIIIHMFTVITSFKTKCIDCIVFNHIDCIIIIIWGPGKNFGKSGKNILWTWLEPYIASLSSLLSLFIEKVSFHKEKSHLYYKKRSGFVLSISIF